MRLLLALQHEGLLPEGTAVDSLGTQALTPALVQAIHAFVAATPSRVMVVHFVEELSRDLVSLGLALGEHVIHARGHLDGHLVAEILPADRVDPMRSEDDGTAATVAALRSNELGRRLPLPGRRGHRVCPTHTPLTAQRR